MNRRNAANSRMYLATAACLGLLILCGCAPPGGAPRDRPGLPPIALPAGSTAVVHDYLKAAVDADGEKMYALIASAEREDETPETLRKTAADRYSSATTWEVLKTDEGDSASKVVVEFKGADVEPNPVAFALTREGAEWRIVDSPELNERRKRGGIHIEL